MNLFTNTQFQPNVENNNDHIMMTKVFSGKTCAAAKQPNFNYGTRSLIFTTKLSVTILYGNEYGDISAVKWHIMLSG